jgi:DEAD/DEAH box helicase domain-containing protein
MLDELVEGKFNRKQVPCLSEIYVHPSFGSELERRSLPALKALDGQLDANNTRFPTVQISQDIKAGKTAYLLTVGGNRYWVDTQVPIEDPVSGLVLCQPDVVISATKAASPMRPIAVFVDGWAFHRNTMPDDARKRVALILRGDYRVWSVTYEDIETALKLKGCTDLDSPMGVLMTPSGQAIPQEQLPQIPSCILPFHAIAWLLCILGQPEAAMQDPLLSLAPVGQHLLFRTVIRPAEINPDIQTRSDRVLAALPDRLVAESHSVQMHGSVNA